MLQQFKSMNDLTVYLGKLEERVAALEAENHELRAKSLKTDTLDGGAIGWMIASKLPKTNLVNPNFFKRAFTVWGHFFVANFLIGIVASLIYFCLMALLFGSIFGAAIQNSGQ